MKKITGLEKNKRTKSRKNIPTFCWTFKKKSEWRDCSRYSQRQIQFLFAQGRTIFFCVHASINGDISYIFKVSFLFPSKINNFLIAMFDWCSCAILMKENNFWGYVRYLPHFTTFNKHNYLCFLHLDGISSTYWHPLTQFNYWETYFIPPK